MTFDVPTDTVATLVSNFRVQDASTGGSCSAIDVFSYPDVVLDGQEYDRSGSLDPLKLWQSGPPSGAVTIADAIAALPQVGDNCAT